MMKEFLSCDWGTSTFRLRLVEAASLKIMAAESNDNGCAAIYKLWLKSNKPESERIAFYQHIIKTHLKILENKVNRSLEKVPLVISGMASSTIGMVNLPYKKVPFLTDGSDIKKSIIEPNNTFPHKIIIISGVKTTNDVMRGEETKLIGCDSIHNKKEQLFILPGTHPKHVIVEKSRVTGFKTFMTGEFFGLLSNESILSSSIDPGGQFEEGSNKSAFEAGVKGSLTTNMLHHCFLVRTNILFNKYSRQENFYFLSGLLIGNELKDIKKKKKKHVVLLGGTLLNSYYKVALEVFNISILTIENADEALIKGQAKFI
ncbi:MAG: 2-dehydro-3-deoxygalactonokinase [Ginsengibacter sp.]